MIKFALGWVMTDQVGVYKEEIMKGYWPKNAHSYVEFEEAEYMTKSGRMCWVMKNREAILREGVK